MIQTILDEVNMQLLNFEKYTESHGWINKILMFTVKNRHTDEYLDFVLKLGESFAGWHFRKTTSEVAIMKNIRENKLIPVPKICAYSDHTQNPIRSHYILMERVKGNILNDGLPKNADVPEERIGPFDEQKNKALIIFNSKEIKAPKTFLEYADINLQYSISEMKKIKALGLLAFQLDAMLVDLNEKFLQSESSNFLNHDDKLTMCHNDLACENLVEPSTIEITGVLDWELYSFEVFPYTLYVMVMLVPQWLS
jgi:hypothetical protein